MKKKLKKKIKSLSVDTFLEGNRTEKYFSELNLSNCTYTCASVYQCAHAYSWHGLYIFRTCNIFLKYFVHVSYKLRGVYFSQIALQGGEDS